MVVRLGDSTPLRRASVLLSADAEGEKSWIAYTNEAGLFELKEVDPGRYRLRVSRDGFVPQEYGQRTPSDPGAVLSLSPGQNAKDLLFRMLPSAVISGRVLNEDGEPLPGVQMAALHYGYSHGKRKIFSNYEARAETNDLGEFRLFGLPPGRYLVRAAYTHGIHEFVRSNSKLIMNDKDSTFAYLPAYYPNSTDAAKAAAIQVKAGEAVSAIDFILSRSRVQKVKGKAFRAAAAKSRRGDMWVYAVSRIGGVAESKMSSHSGQTASDGTFEIADLAPGPYWVRAYESSDEKSYQAQQAVDVGDADVEGVSLVLAPGIELRGHLSVEGKTGSLGGGFTVGLTSDEDPYDQNGGEVKNDGSFVVGNVLEGAYRVWVARESFDMYLKAARYGTVDALENGLTVQRGSEATLEITLSPNGARIEGSVTNADSLPAAGVWVVLVPEAARRNQERLFKTTTTDQNGRFVLRGIPPGEYKLFSWEEVEPGAWFDLDFLKPYESKGEAVRIEEGGHASVDLKLIPADKLQQVP
ncbi:MAG TPA: carboxypeptidase-like regulatory domain-containing protein [Candidatus Acidoferrales bacterium]|nr:carboxypeptidase-like regulatory domain-containing protein [Candidatus Acidoferrales bacterium]